MNTEILQDIGLTQGEIKVYMALLELGPSGAGSILDKAGVHNSVFHFCANSLIDKGLVSYTKKGKSRIYRAADPEQFKHYLKDKEEELNKILPELKARQNFAKEKQAVELFEGMKGIITLLNELIEEAQEGDEFLFFAPELEQSEEIQEFYHRYDAKRKAKGLITKGIVPVQIKKLFEKRKYLEMKYLKAPVPANSAICKNKMALISWTEKPTGVLIHSQDLVEKQKEFFKAMWEKLP